MKENLEKILAGERIPIIGFVEPLLYERYVRDDFAVTEEQAFADAKACGLDIIVGAQYNLTDHPDVVEKILRACEKVGLYYLVRDNAGFKDKTEEEAERYFKERYTPFLKYKSFGGINPTDEPGYSVWERIRKFRRAFHKVFPDKLYFVNLLQNYAPAWALSNGAEREGGLKPDGDYEFYCTSYVKQADPTFFCYDFYPFNGEYPKIQPDYFKQLETVYSACAVKDIPVWCFVQSSAFPDMSGIRRAPTYEEMLWQVNTSLCYGTTGFAYFCYWIPVDDANWHSAFIDLKGNKEKTYDYGKRLNAYIREVEKYFAKASVCAVERNGRKICYRPFESQIKTEGDAVTSFLKQGGEERLFIANATFEKDTAVCVICGEDVKGLFDPIAQREYSVDNGKINFTIQKGEATLLTVIKK